MHLLFGVFGWYTWSSWTCSGCVPSTPELQPRAMDEAQVLPLLQELQNQQCVKRVLSTVWGWPTVGFADINRQFKLVSPPSPFSVWNPCEDSKHNTRSPKTQRDLIKPVPHIYIGSVRGCVRLYLPCQFPPIPSPPTSARQRTRIKLWWAATLVSNPTRALTTIQIHYKFQVQIQLQPFQVQNTLQDIQGLASGKPLPPYGGWCPKRPSLQACGAVLVTLFTPQGRRAGERQEHWARGY